MIIANIHQIFQTLAQDEAMDNPPGRDAALVEEEPMTRKALELLRSQYKNTAAFVVDLFQDHLLKFKLRLLCYDLQDLHAEYGETLKQQERGQKDMMLFAANRSAGAWYGTINKMLQRLQSTEIIDELGLHPAPDLGSDALSPDDPRLRSDQILIDLHAKFLLDLAGNRAWSQCFHAITFPYMMCTAFLERSDDRARASQIWKVASAALLALETYVASNPLKADAQVLLHDIGTNHWQLVREFLVEGRKNGWDPESPAIRDLVWACFSGAASTKALLESGFNSIKDRGARQSKGHRMGPYTRWSYLALNPYAQTSGIPQCEVVAKDFVRMATKPDAVAKILSTKPFSPASTALPRDAPSRKDIQNKWRPAGYLANREATAAMALTMKLKDDFTLAQHAWAGFAGFNFGFRVLEVGENAS